MNRSGCATVAQLSLLCVVTLLSIDKRDYTYIEGGQATAEMQCTVAVIRG
ncbi:MAG: hypothetical protein IH991_11100 [Planctomycetes bacterium]|nr:hypothetical protein [Planctomycetota bacterium]